MIHSAATLRYFLLDGRARLEPLRVFDSRRVEWQGRVVIFWALGTSHAVLLELGDTVLTELLTCAAGDLDAQVLEERAASSDCVISRVIENLQYDCRLPPFQLDGGDRLRDAFRSTDQLCFTYEMDHGQKSRWYISAGVLAMPRSWWRLCTPIPTKAVASEARAPSRSCDRPGS